MDVVKIIAFDVFRYSLPLALPLMFQGKSLAQREGLIVQLTGETHAIGFGEIAPLPGFSQERLQEAQKQTLELRENLLNRRIPARVEELTWHFETWLRPFRLFPSVRCGLETAVLNLLADSREVTLCEILDGRPKSTVPMSALLQGTQKQMTREVKQCLQKGIHSYKLKVGASDVYSDIERIAIVRSLIPQSAALRIDANQTWDYAQASSFAKALTREYVEYIEEPTKDNLMLGEFFKVTHLPVALDESLRELPLTAIKELKGVKAFVLKPMMLGGFEKVFEWVRLAKELGIEAVISSSFESGVGVRALAHLASAAAPAVPAGLDTLKWFERDLYKKELKVQEGSIDWESMLIEKNSIDFGCLEPVKKG